MMKKIVTLILLGVLSLACMTAAAQNTPSANAKNHAQQRQAMMLQKKEFIQNNFELKAEQSSDFWAAYDKYSATELQIHKEQRSMLDKAGVPHFGDTTTSRFWKNIVSGYGRKEKCWRRMRLFLTI